MKVVAVTSEKGGVGKTTISTHLASLLAIMGKRVLLIDADPQGHATVSMGLKKENGFLYLVSGAWDLKQTVRVPKPKVFAYPGKQTAGQLFVIPGSKGSYAVPSAAEDVEALQNILEDAADDIDIVIIDTAPTPGLMMSIIYQASDFILVPTQPEFLSMDGLLGTITDALEYKHRNIGLIGIVPNFYQKATAVHQQNVADLFVAGKQRGWTVLEPLPQRTIFRDASMVGQMVYALPKSATATKDMLRVAHRVLEVCDAAEAIQ